MRLALDAARAIAFHQSFDFADAHIIEIAGDRVLEGARGNREFDRVLGILIMGEAIDKASGEGIAATDAVDDREDVVMLGKMELPVHI